MLYWLPLLQSTPEPAGAAAQLLRALQQAQRPASC